MKSILLAVVLGCVPQTVMAEMIDGDIETEGSVCSVTKVSEGRVVKYGCEIAGCLLSIDVDIDGARTYVSTGYRINRICKSTSYRIKLEGWSYLLTEARNDGLLNGLARVGPGPGPEMCKGDLKARLVKTTSQMSIKNEDVPTRVVSIWEKADTFRDYLEMFADLGLYLKLSDFEGVVFSTMNREEILKHDSSSALETITIPCNAMVYFEPIT